MILVIAASREALAKTEWSNAQQAAAAAPHHRTATTRSAGCPQTWPTQSTSLCVARERGKRATRAGDRRAKTPTAGRRAAPTAKPVQAAVVAEGAHRRQITKQVETFLDTQQFGQRATQLGGEVAQAEPGDRRTPAQGVRSQRQQTGVGAGRNSRSPPVAVAPMELTEQSAVGHPRHVRHRPDRPIGGPRFRSPGDRFQRDSPPARRTMELTALFSRRACPPRGMSPRNARTRRYPARTRS